MSDQAYEHAMSAADRELERLRREVEEMAFVNQQTLRVLSDMRRRLANPDGAAAVDEAERVLGLSPTQMR